MQNDTPRQITVSEMAPHVHSFYAGENKVRKIADWLAVWIKTSLELKKIKPNDFLPLKGDLAFHIGVSKGTIQSAFRMIEDMGLVESKQKIGTFIKNPKMARIEKLTSKRELACIKLKNYIIDNNLQEGSCIESLNCLAKKLQMSGTTIRNAINFLIEDGILEQKDRKFYIKKTVYEKSNIKTKTLVVKIAERIKKHISDNLKIGDKIPSNPELAKTYNVSIKTIHDALAILRQEGIVYTKRGKYGTVVIDSESKTELYLYEKIEAKIREYLIKNCQIGSKLPSIRELAETMQTSPKTIKNALDELSADGYLTFTRGRFGGTFVTDIPQKGNDAYTWLIINPDYVQGNNN